MGRRRGGAGGVVGVPAASRRAIGESSGDGPEVALSSWRIGPSGISGGGHGVLAHGVLDGCSGGGGERFDVDGAAVRRSEEGRGLGGGGGGGLGDGGERRDVERESRVQRPAQRRGDLV